MSDMATTREDNGDTDDSAERAKRHGSHRGRFAFFEAPEIRRQAPDNFPIEDALDTMDYKDLLAEHAEQDVRDALTAMLQALIPGTAVTPLFVQRGNDGMGLVHVWFGPNCPLVRHSHPGSGDCLYYVLAGQLIMGSRVLHAGDGFFVPNGMPYKYRAGPEGVEVLEFRAGGGIEDAPAMKIAETSLESIYRVVETAKLHQHKWESSPVSVADSPLYVR